VREFGIIIFGFVLLFHSNLYADENGIKIEDYSSYYNPAQHISYLVDNNNKLKITDIIQQKYQEKFIHENKEILNFGLTTSTIWLKVLIENGLEDSPFLNIENPAIDTIEYFLFKKEGQFVHHTLTGNFPNSKPRSLKAGNWFIDLHLEEQDEYICYLKINSNSTQLNLPMSISSLEYQYEINSNKNIWNGVYFGLILFLFIYNIFLFSSIKDTSYLYFAIYILGAGFHFALVKGFGLEHLWNNYTSYTHLTPITGSVSMIFCALFTIRFFNSSRRTPIIHFLMQVIIGFYIVVATIKFVGYQALSMQILYYIVALSTILKVALAIVAWIEGFKASKYYLLGWSFFVVGFILLILRDNGIIETTFYNKHVLQISSILSILFIAFAISKKINIYIDKKNEAQKLALTTAIENEKLISNQNQLLEAKVNQRTIDLEQTITTLSKQRQDLSEANGFKDKVLSIISHDLKSPLSSLAGMLNLMKLTSISEIERTDVVNNLETALNNTHNLLDNILDWADKHQRNPNETIEIELYSSVEEIFELFKYQAGIKEIHLRNKTQRGYFVNTNKNMIQLVLRNLISNAIKFTPKNGSITISMKEEFQNLLIYVADTGIGMSQETMNNLFKVDKYTTTLGTENEKGTGLGLKLCKEFVGKFNGEFSVASELNMGSTFTVKLKNIIPILESVASCN